jgi:pimeloyl-ACP methyl ester carboxylesterase
MRLLFRAAFALVLAGLLIAGVLMTIGALYQPNTQIPSGFLGQHVTVNGLPVRVYQRGRGQDVLMIHGSPGSVEDWSPMFGALSTRLRLTAYDRPGHGFSGDNGTYSPSANAALAEVLLDKLDLQDVIVVGHSYGGATALALAVRKPPRVSAYVILDSATYVPSRTAPPLFQMLAIPYLGLGGASVLGAFLAPAAVRKELKRVWKKQPPEDFIALRTRLWAAPKVSHAVAVETVDAAASLAAQSPRYPEIQAPVAILAQADDSQRRSTAERLHHELSHSTLELLSGTGHYIQFEKAEQVCAAIRSLAHKARQYDDNDNAP